MRSRSLLTSSEGFMGLPATDTRSGGRMALSCKECKVRSRVGAERVHTETDGTSLYSDAKLK